MAQVSESRPTSSVQPNIQDVFLNFARRDRLPVTVHLMDGRHFAARVVEEDVLDIRRTSFRLRHERQVPRRSKGPVRRAIQELSPAPPEIRRGRQTT